MKKFILLAICLTLSFVTYSQQTVSRKGRYDIWNLPELPVYPGPYSPDWESLRKVEVPDWFRDAKLGIWSHWNPQSVPKLVDGMPAGCMSKATGVTNIVWKITGIRPNSDIKTCAHYGRQKNGIPMHLCRWPLMPVENILLPWRTTTITTIAGTPNTNPGIRGTLVRAKT